ncbi:hypothetical protein [Melissospora conviva]|uniref:hypothetical protein n=1 Tax=Melissospora conviva TaxID=3388432 RepID=UPI003B7CA9B6
MSTSTDTRNGSRIEGVALVLILLTVAGFAGAASFTHVKDWTLANSPTGTGQWFGWANAVISELVPVASLLEIRRRRRISAPIGYPMFLLFASAGLSLAAQVAVAKPSPSGWLLSAVPALAFMALIKLVLAPTTVPEKAGHTITASETAAPAADSTPQLQLVDEPTPAAITTPEPATPEPATPEPATPEPVLPEPAPVEVPSHLLPTARFATVQHEQATGRPITADELADRLSISPLIAGHLLTRLNGHTHNGTPAGGAR